MTITCARWKEIAFSSEYYRSGQKVLVRLGEKTASGGPISGIEDLAGKKVCAPNGSTSMDKLRTFTDVEAVGADTHTGCLVLFQQGAVDGITGDDTVLAGLAAQDPYADVVQAPAFTAEPYGLGVNAKNVDFVRFVNGVLERDARRRPLDQELQHLARRLPRQGAGPAAAGLRTGTVISVTHGATAPTAPGRLGQPLGRPGRAALPGRTGHLA